jgi:starch phosphorylase
MEASGTGNMKLALNGALTIGTLDGANIEIMDRVGAENLHIFGLTAAEVEDRRRAGTQGRQAIEASPRLGEVLEAIEGGLFSPEDPDRYRGLVADLRGTDWFQVTTDFDAYWEAQRAADARWRGGEAWGRAAVLNTARMGWFSSDRSIADYAEQIWRVPVGRG